MTIIRDEQKLMRAFIEREAPRPVASAQEAAGPPPAGDVRDDQKADKDKSLKNKVEAVAPARRRVEPARDAARATDADRTVAVAVPPPAARTPADPPAVVAVESGPLVAAPEEVGLVTRIASAAVALTHRAAEASGLPAVAGLLPAAPSMTARSEAWRPSGHLLDLRQ